jgi:hypothetical protein
MADGLKLDKTDDRLALSRSVEAELLAGCVARKALINIAALLRVGLETLAEEYVYRAGAVSICRIKLWRWTPIVTA